MEITNKTKNKERKELYLICLVLLSLYLSLGESLIPKPFPWMKLGFASLGTLIGLRKFGGRMAVEIVILRILIQGVMLGTVFTPGFIISLVSGVFSVGVMVALYTFKEKISIVTISMVSGFTHNLVQLVVVYLLLFRDVNLYTSGILSFVFIFLLIGMVSGIIIGVISNKILIREVKL